MDTQEPKVKINARIDADLHRWILAEGLSVSQATQEGITLLKETRARERDTKADNGTQEHTHGTQESTQASDTKYNDNDINVSHELKRLLEEKDQRIEEKDQRIEEKDRHIETLKADINQAHKDKEAIQNLYDNYMRQMQTLINQKAIEAPGAKKPWYKFW